MAYSDDTFDVQLPPGREALARLREPPKLVEAVDEAGAQARRPWGVTDLLRTPPEEGESVGGGLLVRGIQAIAIRPAALRAGANRLQGRPRGSHWCP